MPTGCYAHICTSCAHATRCQFYGGYGREEVRLPLSRRLASPSAAKSPLRLVRAGDGDGDGDGDGGTISFSLGSLSNVTCVCVTNTFACGVPRRPADLPVSIARNLKSSGGGGRGGGEGGGGGDGAARNGGGAVTNRIFAWWLRSARGRNATLAFVRPCTKSASASARVGGDGGACVGAEVMTTVEGLMNRVLLMRLNAFLSSGSGSTYTGHVRTHSVRVRAAREGNPRSWSMGDQQTNFSRGRRPSTRPVCQVTASDGR
jgi:hypothetical protein